MSGGTGYISGLSLVRGGADSSSIVSCPVDRREAQAYQDIPAPGISTCSKKHKLKFPVQERERVLLLQGPVGPFFEELRGALDEAGYDVWRICFHAGDRFFAGRNRRLNFNGRKHQWRPWLENLLVSGNFSQLILFGATRPAHQVAREVALSQGLRLWSLEEGYVRPGFVTIEVNGNNADSPLAGNLPPVDAPDLPQRTSGVPSSFKTMCGYAATYYIARTVFGGWKQRDLYHRKFNPFSEPFFWGRNVTRALVGRVNDYLAIERLLEHHDGRYFIVPLQVAVDGQMKQAARGWTACRLVNEVLRSFARAAPAETHLVFKIHPLERGHSDARTQVRRLAAELGVGSRVHVIDTGSMGLLSRHSSGMITINSTSGLSAIHHGIPLMVIGDALYSHPALATVSRGAPDFDSFWTDFHIADKELRRQYLGWIASEALIPGDFYSSDGIPQACAGIINKLGAPAVAITNICDE